MKNIDCPHSKEIGNTAHLTVNKAYSLADDPAIIVVKGQTKVISNTSTLCMGNTIYRVRVVVFNTTALFTVK
jgi:hypothetical protein